jgi:hypothetical protein
MDIIKPSYINIAEGQTGTQVSAILNDTLSHVFGVERYNFNQTDIVDYALSYVHSKGTYNIMVRLYDNNWIEQPTAGLFTLTSDSAWKLDVPNDITGTWHLIITYLPE